MDYKQPVKGEIPETGCFFVVWPDFFTIGKCAGTVEASQQEFAQQILVSQAAEPDFLHIIVRESISENGRNYYAM